MLARSDIIVSQSHYMMAYSGLLRRRLASGRSVIKKVCDSVNITYVTAVTFGSNQIQVYWGRDKGLSLVGSYQLLSPEHMPEKQESRWGDKDSQS